MMAKLSAYPLNRLIVRWLYPIYPHFIRHYPSWVQHWVLLGVFDSVGRLSNGVVL